jgi:hypothetical protein
LVNPNVYWQRPKHLDGCNIGLEPGTGRLCGQHHRHQCEWANGNGDGSPNRDPRDCAARSSLLAGGEDEEEMSEEELDAKLAKLMEKKQKLEAKKKA